MPPAGETIVAHYVTLWPHESQCCVCGTDLIGCRKGIAMFEGCAVPHDWKGLWGGRDACDSCFEQHERGLLPTWPHPPNPVDKIPI